MSLVDEQAIPLSKIKLILLLLLACGFVLLGVGMLRMDATEIEAQRRFNSPWLAQSIGWVGVLFFGLCGVFAARKLFDTTPGLVLSEQGLFDNSSAVAAGLIPWAAISGFGVYELQRQKMLVVRLHDAEPYIATGNPMKRGLNRMNHKLCGSPIVISANALKIRFDELQQLCDLYFTSYGRAAPPLSR
jgi:hypothetical protein